MSADVDTAVAQPAPLTRNERYYLNDVMSVFQVETQLFKIHRHFLVKESEVFNTMFQCPPGPGAETPDGADDAHPILTPGVTVAEFEALLDFFYTDEFHEDCPELHTWLDLLSIATRYDFQRLRERAIDVIDGHRWNGRQWGVCEEFDPITRIVLAEKHAIPHWLTTAYIALCERGTPLQLHEVRTIGVEKAVLIAEAREKIRDIEHAVDRDDAVEYMQLPVPPFTGTIPELHVPRPPSPNGFYHDRSRVRAVIDAVFNPPPPPPMEEDE
ncbi:BTB domain-containing protein [Mycena indigotica]|uniref:BTB domain-containing protein n=1 Tax=Mycena indigotica TaxID=2126181 RepID=A0A8H6VRS0_9AGAR|nr:BTB domain-containing protein [Mycena indigotica]KAF7291419.1 BTB domain-containing protein [Mycena indigotica]